MAKFRAKDVFKRWKEQKKSTRILSAILAISIVLLVPLLIVVGIAAIFSHGGFFATFTKGWVYGIWIAVELVIGGILLYDFVLRGSRRVLKVNKDLENSHFMSLKEIAKNDGFIVTKFSELGASDDGIPIIAERKDDDITIVMRKAIHTMDIATTGTGKTTTHISPTIEILARTKNKPCMVVTDPKGELYNRHAHTLEENGYHVHIVNMRDTYHSTLWNPFNDVMRKIDSVNDPIVQKQGRYIYDGKTYDAFAEAERAKAEWAVRVRNEVYDDLKDLIYTCCPEEASNDKSWQHGARDLIFGMALRMWEDYRDGYLPKEKFNLYNLWWNLTEYARGDCQLLKEYIDDMADEESRAPGMANAVLVSQDSEKTLASYLTSVSQYMHWIADGGVAQLTSGNEIEFGAWDEGANALFIVFPDEKDTRYPLVTLLFVQMFKALIYKSNHNFECGKTKAAELLRSCYFLLDEFGNLPRIPKFENNITIARSRKIWLMPVVQSYKQLDTVYGQDAAGIIRDNCVIKIFMGTDDAKTLNEISDACGKKKTRQVSYSESKDMSVSTSAQSVPLIYPSELDKLNDPKKGIMGNAVVLVTGNYPIRGSLTPFFEALDIYGIKNLDQEEMGEFMFFDETNNRYDVAKFVAFMKADRESEVVDAQEAISNAESEAVEAAIKKVATSKIYKRVSEVVDKLKDKISTDDFVRLSVADTKQKILILDELAEQAIFNGDNFLAADIEKIRSFLIYSGEGDEVRPLESQSEYTNLGGVL